MVNSNLQRDVIYSMGSIGQQFGGAVSYFPVSGHPEYGQTFPLRFPNATQNVSAATMFLDDHALETLLTNQISRNFYYFGHGDGDNIGFLMDSSYLNIKLKRHYYRFVYLDGCETANGGMPAAFGINFNAPQLLSYFQKHGIRPRAFVGNNIKVHYYFGGDYIDPSTGLHFGGKMPPEVSEFLSNFEFYWYFNYDLVSSIYNAINDTPSMPAGWNTGNYLQIFGYDGLRVDAYNWRSDWSN